MKESSKMNLIFTLGRLPKGANVDTMSSLGVESKEMVSLFTRGFHIVATCVISILGVPEHRRVFTSPWPAQCPVLLWNFFVCLVHHLSTLDGATRTVWWKVFGHGNEGRRL